MDDEQLYEELLSANARIDGLQLVLSAALNGLLSVGDLPERLQVLEAAARKGGAHAATIETLRAFREELSAPR